MRKKCLLSAILVIALAACAANGGNRTLPLSGGSAPTTDTLSPMTATSVLKLLTKQTVIGSTVDPTNGDKNPHGLALGWIDFGKVKKGYPYVCNFSAKSGVQGTGTTLVSLVPSAGAKPTRFIQSNSMLGCTSVSIDTADYTWTANYGAKSVTVFDSKGKLAQTYKGGNFVRPFSVFYATTQQNPHDLYPTSATFVSDASTGSIILVQSCITGSCSNPNVPIITGFKVNNGKPGNILGPSGLAFDLYGKNATLCNSQPCPRLWIVDGANNAVYYIDNVLNIRNAKSIVVNADGKTFSGPLKSWAHLVYSGKPLNGPISGAIVRSTKTGEANFVVGNTLDPNGKNLLLEFSPAGKVLDTVNVDKGKMRALFGITSTGAGASTKLFFNDDNKNELEVLSQ